MFTLLYSFAGTDGAHPYTGLVAASDGNLYGTTSSGGANGQGTLFKITLGGQLTTIYNFCTLSGCTDGSAPMGALVEGTDGNFYGTTLGGGTNGGGGTIFSVTRGGKFTPLYSFAPDDFPSGGLVQGTDGSFYGTTLYGGGGVCNNAGVAGTVFANDHCGAGANFVREPLPTSGKVGTRFTILGNNLTDTIIVTLNGISVPYTVLSSTEIRAMVPTGATTGYISVIAAGDWLKSNVKFRVP